MGSGSLYLFFLCASKTGPANTAEQLRREGKNQKRNQKRTMRRPQPPINKFAAGTQKERQSEPILKGQQLVCQNSASHTVSQRIFTFRKVGIQLFLVSVTLGPSLIITLVTIHVGLRKRHGSWSVSDLFPLGAIVRDGTHQAEIHVNPDYSFRKNAPAESSKRFFDLF